MAQAAEQSGSVISAVLFGALAGTGVLPFSRAQFEATIARGGVGVAPSLEALRRAASRARRARRRDAGRAWRRDARRSTVAAPWPRPTAPDAGGPRRRAATRPARSRGRALVERMQTSFPAQAHASLRRRRSPPDRLPGRRLRAALPRSHSRAIARAAGRRRRRLLARDRAPPRALDVLRGHGPRRRAEDAGDALRARPRRGARRRRPGARDQRVHAPARCRRSARRCRRASAAGSSGRAGCAAWSSA